jgi:hypothetical protein
VDDISKAIYRVTKAFEDWRPRKLYLLFSERGVGIAGIQRFNENLN